MFQTPSPGGYFPTPLALLTESVVRTITAYEDGETHTASEVKKAAEKEKENPESLENSEAKPHENLTVAPEVENLERIENSENPVENPKEAPHEGPTAQAEGRLDLRELAGGERTKAVSRNSKGHPKRKGGMKGGKGGKKLHVVESATEPPQVSPVAGE
jgi:hypothetical protein